MRDLIRQGPGHATIVAYLALFVALGGSAYAVTVLPANSVGSKQIRNGAVTLRKVSTSARRALRGGHGPQGPRGAQGSAGVQGLKGATGDVGPSGPDSGTAGGALSGSFPNPSLAAGAVTSSSLASGAVTNAALGAGSVLPADFGTIPAARVTIGPNGALGVNSGTLTPLMWDGLTLNSGNAFNNSIAVEQLQAPRAGIYQIDGGIEWLDSGQTAGRRFIAIEAAGVCCSAASVVNSTTGADTIQNTSDLLRLNVGDRVTLVVEQTGNASLDIAQTDASFVAMHWVGP